METLKRATDNRKRSIFSWFVQLISFSLHPKFMIYGRADEMMRVLYKCTIYLSNQQKEWIFRKADLLLDSIFFCRTIPMKQIFLHFDVLSSK